MTAVQAEQRQRIYHYAANLPEHKRPSEKQLRALELWSRGFGYQRIGAILGIGRDNAAGRVRRCLDRLERDALKEEAA